MFRLTDCPDMTTVVYRGRKTTTQQQPTGGLPETGMDRIMTGIDKINFIRILKRVCIVNVFILLTETCLQKVSYPITAY